LSKCGVIVIACPILPVTLGLPWPDGLGFPCFIITAIQFSMGVLTWPSSQQYE
jgi:hypothetical protein